MIVMILIFRRTSNSAEMKIFHKNRECLMLYVALAFLVLLSFKVPRH